MLTIFDMKMFENSSYEAENKSQYLTLKWQLKILLFKCQGHFEKMELKFTNTFLIWGN